MRVMQVGPDPTIVGGLVSYFVGICRYLERAPDVILSRVNETELKGHSEWDHPSSLALLNGSLRALRGFRAAMGRERPDVIHLHAACGRSIDEKAAMAWMARRRGIGCVVHMHGLGPEVAVTPAPRRLWLGAALSPPTRVVCLSETLRGYLRAALPRCMSLVVPNAIEVPRAVVDPSDRPRTLGFVARLFGQKGETDLLDALALCKRPEWQLLVAGDGPYRPVMEERSRALGIQGQVRFVGKVSGVTLKEFLQTIDLLCLPSHRENFPMVLLEAMSFARPVVATSVGGIPEMVTDGEHGWLVPPARPDILAEAISSAMRDGDELRIRGRRAREHVCRHYSWHVVGPRMLQVYREALDRSCMRS